MLVLRLALRGVSGFWLLHPSYKYKKALQSRHEMDYMEEEAGGVARATLEVDPRCSQSPPAFRAAMQVKQGGL